MIREYSLRVIMIDETDCYFIRPGELVRMTPAEVNNFLQLVNDKPELYLPPAPSRSRKLAKNISSKLANAKYLPRHRALLLHQLAQFNEPITAREAATLLGAIKSTISSKLSNLKADGFLMHENARYMVNSAGHQYLVEHEISAD